MASLGVPGMADTIAALRLARWFKMLLLPTLGDPIIATLTPDLTNSPLLSAGHIANGSVNDVAVVVLTTLPLVTSHCCSGNLSCDSLLPASVFDH